MSDEKIYNADAGTKSIYESVTNILRGDSVLKGLMDYKAKTPNILRGFQSTSGEWKKLLVYYMQPEFNITDFSANIRNVPLIVNIYSRLSDLILSDIGERVVQLLHGVDLSVEGKVRVFDCTYTGEAISLAYNDTLQANQKALRFLITFRKEV